MSPFQHGEVFVTEDGAETDLDIGHYERFVDENMSRNASHSAGAIWDAVLRKERKGDFLGATVQVIPHITNEIKARIKRAAQGVARRRRHLRDRRHGRRHRVAPVPRGDPPVPARGRPRERPLPPLHARPVHRGGRRAEDEADAALGQRAAPDRHPPRRDRLPLARGALPGHQGQDRALRRRRHALGGRVARRLRRLPRACRAAGGGARRARRRAARDRRAAGRARGVAGPDRSDRRAARRGHDRARRQVREAARRLPVGARGAQARRRPAGRPRPRPVGRRREHVLRGDDRAARGGRRRARAGRLRLARLGGQDPRLPGRARARDPVPRHLPRHARRGLRVRPPRLPDSTAPTRPRWTPRRRTR